MHLRKIKNRLNRENQFVYETSGDNVEVSGLSADSREIEEGDLFLAVRGYEQDGHDYIEDAIRNGAVAVVCEEPPTEFFSNVPIIIVRNSRKSEGICADEFYGRPSDELTVIGVTGTNGKTTTTYLIYTVLESLGYRTGLVGTIENRVADRVIPADRTTPPPGQLHSLLEQMHEEGCSFAVLEVSSHGLDQHRSSGVSFDAGVFTNLSRDHLDYHDSMEAYCNAKARLFKKLSGDGIGVINADNEYGHQMAQACDGEVVRYGRENGVPYQAEIEELSIDGSRWTLEVAGSDTEIEWSLTGEHNVDNALAAASVVHQITGEALEDIGSSFKMASPVKGRLDPVEWNGNFHVMVDYAHTPDAIENVLEAVRPLVEGSIRVVFGCGGDRDCGKRPQMGRTVYERADQLYVTSDNPRSEEPMKIIKDILEGIEKPEVCHVEPEREKAIRRSIEEAEKGDVVLILGKGHETVQKKDGVVRPFKDWAVAGQVLENLDESPS